MAVILSEREKKQWNEIKTLAKNSNFFMLEDKDVVRMKRILDLLKNQGYIQDTDVGGTNIFLIVGNFQDFDDWLKDEENKQMSMEWESKRKFDEETQRMVTSSIVNGQPFVNGMRIMDAASEEILAAILKTYDGNESRHVHGSVDDIPVPYATTLISELQKLRMYGVVTSIHANIFGAWEATLTPQGLSYFDDKEKALKAAASVERTPTKPTRKEFDVFISHANKDKLSYVNDLNRVIKKLGINVFYDTDVLSWGDNFKQVILDGTAKSEFAIIVISKNFFDREWTERELDEFLAQQNATGQKIVLPLLYGVTFDELKEKYPTLGDIQAITSKDYTKPEIAILLAKELIKRYK